jgi:hypothetical protein
MVLKRQHNHNQDYVRAEAQFVASEIKSRALTTTEKSKDIIKRSLSESNQNLIVAMPSVKSMVNNIAKVRKSNSIVIPEKNEHLSDSFRKTLNNGKFLFYEHLEIEGEKLLLFTTFSNLVHLSHTDVWVCDGTFYSYPAEFCQLYTISGCVREKFYPLVYVLMEKRDTKSYNLVFNYIISKLSKQPKFIIIDFELAVLVSLKIFSNNCFISTCFFTSLNLCGGIYNLQADLLNIKPMLSLITILNL